MTIGIVPHSQDFSHPSDRRKFVKYCQIKNLDFEIAKFNKYYDILYISGNADLNLWSEYKKKK